MGGGELGVQAIDVPMSGYRPLVMTECGYFSRSLIGQSMSALPSGSDVDLLGNCESIIDLDAEIPDGALDLGMPQEQLNCPQVTSSPVDQGRLGSTQRMRAKQ